MEQIKLNDNVSEDYKNYHIIFGTNEYNEKGYMIKDIKGNFVKPAHLEGDIGLFKDIESAKAYIDYIIDLQNDFNKNQEIKPKSLYEVTGRKSMLAKHLAITQFTGKGYVLKDHIHGFYEGLIKDIKDPNILVYTSKQYAEDRNNFRNKAPGSYDVIEVNIKNGKIIV